MFGEIWVPVKFAPNYEISSYGDVRRLNNSTCGKKGKLLKPFKLKGYWAVRLCANSEVKYYTISVVVLRTFWGNKPFPHYQCAHIDGDKDNNHYSNLKWVTPKENTSHKKIHGTQTFGDTHPSSILSEEKVREIKKLFPVMTQRKIAAKFNVHPCTINDIKMKRRWSHV